MGEKLGSTHFRALFGSTLQEYEKITGITLAQHPLAIQIQNSRSTKPITSLLQDQIGASSHLGRNDRIINSVKSTISLLSTLSSSTALDWAIDLVRLKQLMVRSTSLTGFSRHSYLKVQYTLVSLSYLLYVAFFTTSYVPILITSMRIRRPRA
jgi:hypothetical protein